MKVAVIGAGYVGLTTAACLASLGHDVVCADIDEERVARLSGGDVPIREEGLLAHANQPLGVLHQRLPLRMVQDGNFFFRKLTWVVSRPISAYRSSSWRS